MPQFKSYHQNQLTFLPQNITDCLPRDHVCFVIDEVVNGLDLKPIENTYKDGGCPAYDPAALIKIMFYAYTQGVRSSRKIEAQTYENVVFRWLSANQNPDHGTINLFRQKHLTELEIVFAQIVILCGGLGMVNLKDVSIDGTVIKASASKKNTVDKEQIEKLKKKIREILREAAEVDEAEDKKYGKDKRGDEIPERLIDPKTRREEIDKLKKKLKLLDQAETIISEKQKNCKDNREKNLTNSQTTNTTDKDANLLKQKDGKHFKPSYNGQISASNQVILAYDVSSDGNDAKQLLPMIEKTEQNTGEKVEVVKADSIYFSKENIEGVNEKQIDAYIPDKNKSIEERQENANSIPEFDRRNFNYDAENDEFICPGNQRLSFVFEEKGVRKYVCKSCSGCKLKSGCAKGKNRYLYLDHALEKYKADMRKKLNSESGKAKYLERMSEIESVFGNILHNLKARYFHCRGKPKVKTELGLICVAHNLVKISNWLKKNKENEEIKMQNLKLDAFTRLPTAA